MFKIFPFLNRSDIEYFITPELNRYTEVHKAVKYFPHIMYLNLFNYSLKFCGSSFYAIQESKLKSIMATKCFTKTFSFYRVTFFNNVRKLCRLIALKRIEKPQRLRTTSPAKFRLCS